jgi:hypothetical protein
LADPTTIVPLAAFAGEAAARGSLEPEPHAATLSIAATAVTATTILVRFMMVSL